MAGAGAAGRDEPVALRPGPSRAASAGRQRGRILAPAHDGGGAPPTSTRAGRVRGDHGHAGRHRLQHRQPEALRPAGRRERARPGAARPRGRRHVEPAERPGPGPGPRRPRVLDRVEAGRPSYELLVSTTSPPAARWSCSGRPGRGTRRCGCCRSGATAGPGTARRIGTAEARGRIVVWTDADMTYPNERIPEFVRYLLDNADVDQVGRRPHQRAGHATSCSGCRRKWAIRKVAERLAGDVDPRPELRRCARSGRDVGAAVPAAAAARVLLRHHDHAGVPVQPARRCDYLPIDHASGPAGRSSTSPGRLPVHPAGAPDGHVLQPDHAADAGRAVAARRSAPSRRHA